MSFLFFKSKTAIPSKQRATQAYDPLNPLKYFPNGLTIQTSGNRRYILNAKGYLESQRLEMLEDTEELKYQTEELESLVDGRVLCIGALPTETAEQIDEYIAESFQSDSKRMRHYHNEAQKLMKQFAQNPTASPYLSRQCFPLAILYQENAAIKNERLGLYFSNWKLINPTV
jgi:hypothetical protein